MAMMPANAANQTLWLVVIFTYSLVLGFTLPLHFSLMAFADDYGFWKTGVRASGLNFAFNLFFIKLAWASSAAIISVVLVIVAYQPGLDNQTHGSLTGISMLETSIPAVIHLLLAFMISKSKLDMSLMARISSDLKARLVNA
jgi:Na+/melibiose symporter-like transporter